MSFCSCIYGSSAYAAIHPAETHPAEIHPAEIHPAESHPAETHPAESHPAERENDPLKECPICLETISSDFLINCSNPDYPHGHHIKCVEDYSPNVPLGKPVGCSLRCGYVFQSILGSQPETVQEDSGPRVEELNWGRLNSFWEEYQARSQSSRRAYSQFPEVGDTHILPSPVSSDSAFEGPVLENSDDEERSFPLSTGIVFEHPRTPIPSMGLRFDRLAD
jgi:hypothetical protein